LFFKATKRKFAAKMAANILGLLNDEL